MARIKGRSAKASLVFHDGTSMVVINKGSPFNVEDRFEQKLIDAGVIDGEAKKTSEDQPIKADSAGQSEPAPAQDVAP